MTMEVGKRFRWRCPCCGTFVGERVVEALREGQAKTRCEVCGCAEAGPADASVSGSQRPWSWKVVEKATKEWR